jgi:polyhydroxyalkanoate synthesis regulator phasin
MSNDQALDVAIDTIALMQKALENIDRIEKNQLFFKQSLKYKGKLFVEELERFTKDFYIQLNKEAEEGELELYRRIKNIESAIGSAIEVEKRERELILLKN